MLGHRGSLAEQALGRSRRTPSARTDTSWSQPQVFTDSWVEVASTITLIAFVIGVYRHLECHKTGCHRLGGFMHGRYKRCHIHDPNVPDSGKITQEYIDSDVAPSP